jgi:hypothetical protein
MSNNHKLFFGNSFSGNPDPHPCAFFETCMSAIPSLTGSAMVVNFADVVLRFWTLLLLCHI